MVENWNDKPMPIKPSKIRKFNKVLSLINRSGSLLDVGCGNGLLHSNLCFRDFTSIDAFDYTPEYVREAEQKYHNFIDYKVHDACKPFPYDKTFDVILCVEVMEHVPSPYLVMENMYNACSEGGICIVSTPNALWYEIKYFNNMKYKMGEYNFQYLSPNILLAMMNKAGFRVDYSSNRNLGKIRHIFLRGVKD